MKNGYVLLLTLKMSFFILDFKVPECSRGVEVYCMWLWHQPLSRVFKETWQRRVSRGNRWVCVMEYSGAPLGKWNLSRPHTETCRQGLLLIQAFLHLVPSSRFALSHLFSLVQLLAFSVCSLYRDSSANYNKNMNQDKCYEAKNLSAKCTKCYKQTISVSHAALPH